jgi:hypothetical protein
VCQELQNLIDNPGSGGTGTTPDLTDLTERVDDNEDSIDALIAALIMPPNYLAPTASLTNVTQTVEKGSSLGTFALNISFSARNGGAPTGYELRRNGTVISNAFGNNVTENTITSTITYQATVTYAQGPILDNALGVPDDRGRIAAGNVVTGNRVITPRLYVFTGAVDSLPTNNTQILALQRKVFDNAGSTSFNATTTKRTFVHLVPFSSSNPATVSGINQANNFTVLLDQRTTINYTLADGTTEQYHMYSRTNINAYGSNDLIVISL